MLILKKKLTRLLLAAAMAPVVLFAQSPDQNYILTQTYKTATTTPSGDINVAFQDVAYFDGLGRPLQQVSAYTSPVFTGGKPADLVTHTEYDAYGRVSKVYLPYPHSSGNAAYQSTAPTAANSYYNSADFTEANSRGYALTEYEASPLNRVTKQYAGGTDKAVEFLYGVNGSNDVKLYTVSGNTLNQSSYYAANQLSYVETKDENGDRTREYKDKQGLVILKRAYVDKTNNSSNLDTYFVYDDLDRIRFVLQPSYQDNASAERYFYYEYNDRGLLVKKKVPGAGTTELTYNDRDLLYTSLDANKKTTYYKYDALNRLIETGIKTGAVENALTKTFYDTYPAELPTFNNNVAIGYPSTMRSNVTGMQTGTATLVINPDSSLTTNFLYSAVYYNDRLQVIQEVKQLYDLGGFRERSASVLRYDGQLEKKIIYQQTDKGVNSVEKTYRYDQADRVLRIRNAVKKENTVMLDVWTSATTYTGTGLVKNKYLHSTEGTHYRERLEHQYNPRSWLRKVEGKTSAATNFGVELRYANASEAQHNGNIGEMLWLKDGAWNGYRLKYDGVNRLTEALNTDVANGIWEKVTEYDKNGNLKKLQRGKAAETWDNLEYFLSDNRLTSINDAGNANGVKNGSSAYAYDDGGNLTSDGNKGATIAYNRLNLPRSVSIGGKTLGYYYDGNGNKLRMANGAVNTKYAGLFEYDESNYLTRIATEEGQIAVTGNGNTYTPNYYLKDHLGNVRAVINKEGTILQETEYFPFGLAIPRSGTDAVNRYQFLNREKQPETGYMDLVRRFYDPSIGRFMQMDPVTETQENYSTYQYGWNNPILRSDPNGDYPDGGDDPFLTARLITTAFFDTKHAIINTGARLLGSDIRAGYKTENGRQVFQTEITRGTTGNVVQEVIGTVADIATVATAGTNPVSPGNLLSKTSSTQVIRAGKEVASEVVAYKRPSGSVTSAQRASVQGKPCVDCGATAPKMVADHKKPLVKEHYETGSIDKANMRSVDAVQPQCPTCSAKQGADMSRYSREQKKKHGLD